MHDVVVVAFEHAHVHDLATENGRRDLKMIEAAAA
jgi:hypothetical protein